MLSWFIVQYFHGLFSSFSRIKSHSDKPSQYQAKQRFGVSGVGKFGERSGAVRDEAPSVVILCDDLLPLIVCFLFETVI